MVISILQWNARSVIANGQEFKKFITELDQRPSVICVQETWLNKNIQFKLHGYCSVRKDREGKQGGGVMTFIQEGVPYRSIAEVKELECVGVEIFYQGGAIEIYNYYNPCNKISQELLNKVGGKEGKRELWCGDFNAHNWLWGSDKIDINGEIVEQFMEERSLVCLNNGEGTRYNIRTNNNSSIDLTMISNELAEVCEWRVINDNTIGSDHFPIICEIRINKQRSEYNLQRKWLYRKAEWESFNEYCEKNMNTVEEETVETFCESLSKIIMNAAMLFIPCRKGGKKIKSVPWWTEECNQVIKERNKLFKQLKRKMTMDNLLVYKKSVANVRRTIKNAKRVGWRNFCTTIGKETPLEKIWNMIRNMSGKGKKEYQIPVLLEKNVYAVSDEEKANMLGKVLEKAHKIELGKRYEDSKKGMLERNKNIREKKDVKDGNMDMEFSITELKIALKGCANTAPGQDGLSYKMFKHLSDKMLTLVLRLYNRIWNEGIIPKAWNQAIVMPIVKPGKDPSSPGSYRPIALTSNLGKLMEKMISKRLFYELEKKEKLSKFQSGFRRGRSTMDALIKVSNEIEKAIRMKEVMVVVYFDIEKAYDTVWREGVLIKAANMGITGKMYNWLLQFLFERSFVVRVGSSCSSVCVAVNGIPQGSVISPLLFNIMINDIFEDIGQDIGCALYADDGVIWKRGRNVRQVITGMQAAIKKVEEWTIRWRFKMSTSKSSCMYFTRKRVIPEHQKLVLYNTVLEQVKSVKYLGVWFDSGYRWEKQIDEIDKKCRKCLNVMRAIAGKEWGAERSTLMMIYQGLIRSVLDYGCIIYSAASQTLLKRLDSIQYRALRICMGAVKSTPVNALMVEANEMPLELRRKKLSLIYWKKMESYSGSHIGKEVLNNCWEYIDKKGRGFGWEINSLAKKLKMNEIECSMSPVWGAIPPWILPDVVIDLEILEKIREWEEMGLVKYNVKKHVQEKFYGSLEVYTDGSKDPVLGVTGIGIYIPEIEKKISKRLSDKLSIFSVEMSAIIIALSWMEETRPDRILICSDSASVLESLVSRESEREDLVNEVYTLLHQIQNNGGIVGFCWIPAHKGIKGNEVADELAKKALKGNIIDVRVPLGKGEIKSVVRDIYKKEWQEIWDKGLKGRHLYRIKKQVITNKNIRGRNRKEEVILLRLRLGHTRLNSSLALVGRHDNGLCEYCSVKETVEHVLVHCRKYRQERSQLVQYLVSKGQEEMDLGYMLGIEVNRDGLGYRELMQFLESTGLSRRI